MHCLNSQEMKSMSRRQPFMVLMVLVSGLATAPINTAIAQVPGQGIGDVLPDSVKEAVLQAASVQTGLKPEQLALTQAQSKIWSDGCLGLSPPEQMCAAVLVQGWEVRVAHQRQEWVYRTNASGREVRFDPAGGRLSQLVTPVAEQIPRDRTAQKWDKAIAFRATKTGGFAGVTEEITLYKKGRLEQKGGPGGVVTRTLSKKAVKAFQKKLYQLNFGQFDGLRYPPPKGAADYFTVTLSNGQTTVQYADIERESLPKDLQAVIQLWQSSILETPH
jgi:hypothetical protein